MNHNTLIAILALSPCITHIAVAEIIQIHGASNTGSSNLQGTSSQGKLTLTKRITSESSSKGIIEFQVSQIDLNQDGKQDDTITISFNVTGNDTLYTPQRPTASGWLATGGPSFKEKGQWINIRLNSLTTHIAGSSKQDNALFLGFNGCSMGSWNIAGERYNPERDGATLNGIRFFAKAQNEHIPLDLTQSNLKVCFNPTKGGLGEWRLKGFSFQIKSPGSSTPNTIASPVTKHTSTIPKRGALMAIGNLSIMLEH